MSKPGPSSRAVDDVVVSVSGLTKTYKTGAKALKGIELEIKRGSLFGLIGPDGAGKTTTLKILAGVMQPTNGKVLISGTPANHARKLIGYVPQNCALYPELSVEENLSYQAGLHGVSRSDYEELRSTHLGSMGLLRFADRLASQLSGGMKQKLALCCALVSDPQLILLDEPTTGLDPISRHELWDALDSLKDRGVTTVIATPFLEEAERCDRIVLMHDGNIHLVGKPDELKVALEMKRLQFNIAEDDRINEIPLLLEKAKLSHVKDIYPYGDRLEVLTDDPQQAEEEIKNAFQGEGISFTDPHESAPTMENVFVMRLRELGHEEAPVVEFPRLRGKEQAAVFAQNGRDGKKAILANNLKKQFGNFKAVDDVSIDIEYGEIFGLLGANGAGKTTTIKMLCGLMEPGDGTVEIGGEKIDLRKRSVRKTIGYMSQKFTLYDSLTVKENLDFYASIYEIPFHLRKRQIDWVIEACALQDVQKFVVQKLPLGWKQRIAFGAAVMHEPEILFLDEPTAGIDPLARRHLWTMIREFATNGTAILVTTHYLDEAEFCNTLAFMANGKIVAQGTPSEIKAESDKKTLEDAFIKVVQRAQRKNQ